MNKTYTFLKKEYLPILILLLQALSMPLTVHAQLPTQFQKVELVTGLKNSINFEFAPDGRIFIIDRFGEILIYKPATQTTVSAGTLDVFHDMEDGLLAIAFDPLFTQNNFIYLHYSHPTLDKNRVSRFSMVGDQLDKSSEHVLLEWTSNRNGYYHAAGDMDFDSKGNLYIAVGDNSNHTAYAALNEKDSNQSAERSSSNTNDMRGKILRIKPEPDGSYSIPEGNLFPGGVGGLPEIYVMGARNPFKIYVDKAESDWLFWAEVGPDANVSSDMGPEGMDEINLVKSAGNYGWPYLSGKNEPYLNNYSQPNFYYDYNNPVNLSKWNTGATNLPPAQASWMEFFHACHLVGPKYYYDAAVNNSKKLPSDFNQALFYYDFNTSKIWVVKMDESGNVLTNERFAENIITGQGFIDLKIGPDGQLYILEYGAGCCPGNVGSGKLVRIDYNGIDTNKAPEVVVSSDVNSGPLPLRVTFSSKGSIDPDGDALTYEWDFQSDGIVDSYEQNPVFIFNQKGVYDVQLRVKDSRGATSSKTIKVHAGNTAAVFTFNSPIDGAMINWDDDISFDVEVSDAEDGSTTDGSISCSSLNFVPSFGHLTHSHDGLTINKCAGTFHLDPTGHDAQGQDDIYYVFKVNYTDRDGLTSFDQVTVHPKIMEAEFYDLQSNTKLMGNTDKLGGGNYAVRALTDGAYIMLNGRNLHNIHSVLYRVASPVGGVIEVRADSLTGALLSTVTIPATGSAERWAEATGPISDPGGKHDLYFIFRKPGAINLADLNYIEFLGSGISVDSTPPTVYSLKALSKKIVHVRFNESLDKASAETTGNYNISNNITVFSAALQEDRKTVVLTLSPLEINKENQLTITGIKNEGGIALSRDIVENFSLDEAVVRLNAGGPQVDVDGIQWMEGQFNVGGTNGAKPLLEINNTTSDAIYQTELVGGSFTYNIPVPEEGIYSLKLHLAELVYKNVGERIFNVDIENGQFSLINYDIFARVGFATAHIELIEGIRVNDGFLTVTFKGVVHNAKVSAIEVLYGSFATGTPAITIVNPLDSLTVSQEFNVNFEVRNWEVFNGATHIHKIIDGNDMGDIYATGPVPINNLPVGMHTIKLVLANADHTLTDYSDQVVVNVVPELSCIDNPFPLQWTEHVIGDALPYRSPSITAADIDGDGLKDIISGAWWFKNPGNPKGYWARNVIGSPLNNMSLVYDFDNDGDLDILGTTGTYLGSQLAWAQNDGKGNFIIHSNIAAAASFPEGSPNDKNTFMAGAAVGNFNNVENIQIAIAWNGSETTKTPVKMITVPANPVQDEWTVEDIAPNAVGETITAKDIDNDGDLDLFQAKNWLRNDNGSWTVFNTGLTLPTYYEHNALADLDRDGVLDGVLTQIGENQDVVWVTAPNDPTNSWTQKPLGTDVDSGISLDVVDMDFDGDLDVLVGEWKSEHRLIAFENDLCHSGTWVKHILHSGGTSAPDHHNGTLTFDLDNDGDLDIISVGWDKRIPRIYINEGGSSTNQLPIVSKPLPDTQAVLGSSFSFTFDADTFTDPDGDLLTYVASLPDDSALPAWLSFTAASRTFSGSPSSIGAASLVVKITAKDGKGGMVSDEFAITVPNSPPIVNVPIADVNVISGALFSFTFAADAFTDPNGDTLSYSAVLAGGSALPAWLGFEASSRTFSGTPGAADIGSLDIEVTATDGQQRVSDVFKLTVQDGQSPMVTNGIPDIYASAQVPFSFTFAAEAFTDPNGDALSYSAVLAGGSALPAWLGFEASSRTFSGTPGAADIGSLDIEVTATDGQQRVSDVFSLTVEEAGNIRFNAGGPQVTAYGVPFSADQYFSGGKTYTNTKITDILDTSFDELYKTERNNAFSYQVPLPTGTYLLRLHFAEIYHGATGGGPGGAGKRVFSVRGEGQPLLTDFDIYAEAGAMRALVKEFEVTVSDGELNLDFIKQVDNPKIAAIEIALQAAAPNQPPVVATPIADVNAATGAAFSFTFSAEAFTDPNGDALSYSAVLAGGSALPAWLGFEASSRTFSGTPGAADIGSLDIEVTATDGQQRVSDVFSLTVEEAGNIRFNAGGPQVTAYGVPFSADQYFSGGRTYTNTKITDILDTSFDELYKTERNNAFSYRVPLPTGTYLLRLHFAEIYHGATGGGPGGAGKRVFSVRGEGQPLLTDFDIYAEAGAMRALVKEFEVTVSDGELNLDFIKQVDNPKIAAIEILSTLNESQISASISIINGITASNSSDAFVYPNPFDDAIHIGVTAAEAEVYSVEIYDLAGKSFYKNTFTAQQAGGNEFTLYLGSSLVKPGLYLLQVNSKTGTFRKTFKIIKRP